MIFIPKNKEERKRVMLSSFKNSVMFGLSEYYSNGLDNNEDYKDFPLIVQLGIQIRKDPIYNFSSYRIHEQIIYDKKTYKVHRRECAEIEFFYNYRFETIRQYSDSDTPYFLDTKLDPILKYPLKSIKDVKKYIKMIKRVTPSLSSYFYFLYRILRYGLKS